MKNHQRPNILLITTDQQRKDSIGVYNPKLQTPVLDSLAEDGMVFDRAYIAHPTCTPSRATLLTGQYASTHGAYTIGTALSEDSIKLSDLLSDNGYETYFTGKPHFQQLSTEGSFECESKSTDEAFWKNFRGPYYGFQHTQIHNGHTSYPVTAGMHYRLWLKEKGLDDNDIAGYFNHSCSGSFRNHGAWNLPRELHPSVFVSEKSVNFLDQHQKNSGGKPFFLWCSFTDPHDPHVTPEPYASMYDPSEIEHRPYREGEFRDKPECYQDLYDLGHEALSFSDEFGVPSAPSGKLFGDEQYFREITAVHHGMVKLIDEEIGRIIKKLKESGEYENTLIVFTTDHGDYLGNHGFVYKGFPAFEEVYNVPYIVKSPGEKAPNHRSEALISHVDFAATALGFAEIPIPGEMEGTDQKDVILGLKQSVRSALIIENRPVEKGFYQQMLVTGTHKLVVYLDSEDGELYKLQEDPDQYCNLWNDSSCRDLKQKLCYQLMNRQGLEGDLEETGDTSGLSISECLKSISNSMHAEEPVQKRTSFS